MRIDHILAQFSVDRFDSTPLTLYSPDVEISNNKQAIVLAYKKGYRVNDVGEVISKKGVQLKASARKRSDRSRSQCYRRFTIRTTGRNTRPVPIHALCAYQKYGDAALAEDVVIRHKDGDSLNNMPGNIILGSPKDNANDMTVLAHHVRSLKAAMKKRKLSRDQIIELLARRESGETYKQLMHRFGIAKSTVGYIVNKKTYREDIVLES